MAATKRPPHALKHGQALALQFAVQILINVDREPQLVRHVLSSAQLNAKNAVETTNLGCNYAARIVLPFIVELALKALIAKHNNDQSERTHHLSKLYDALPTNLQHELNQDFENLKQTDVPEEVRSLHKVLVDHDNDFPEWRYLDDPQHLVAASVDTLQFVACSVLNVYNRK